MTQLPGGSCFRQLLLTVHSFGENNTELSQDMCINLPYKCFPRERNLVIHPRSAVIVSVEFDPGIRPLELVCIVLICVLPTAICVGLPQFQSGSVCMYISVHTYSSIVHTYVHTCVCVHVFRYYRSTYSVS